MKKGITSEAAQRLAAFLQKRAQSFDPEEGTLGEAVEDSIWDKSRAMENLFTGAVDEVRYAVEQSVASALSSVEASFSESFDAQVSELSSLVSSSHPEASLPSPQDLEQLKQQFLFDLHHVFTEKLSEWLAQPSADPSMGGYEVRSLFGDAADRGVAP
jgi:hypothetical protein